MECGKFFLSSYLLVGPVSSPVCSPCRRTTALGGSRTSGIAPGPSGADPGRRNSLRGGQSRTGSPAPNGRGSGEGRAEDPGPTPREQEGQRPPWPPRASWRGGGDNDADHNRRGGTRQDEKRRRKRRPLVIIDSLLSRDCCALSQGRLVRFVNL